MCHLGVLWGPPMQALGGGPSPIPVPGELWVIEMQSPGCAVPLIYSLQPPAF